MRERFLVSVCQMAVEKDKGRNLETARHMIAQAAGEGSSLVVLPEMFNCPYSPKFFSAYAETVPDGETYNMLSQAAAEEKIFLVGGSIPEREDNCVYNSSFVFAPDGSLLGRHRKIHLYDVDLPGLRIRESDTIKAGDRLAVIGTDLCVIGVCVCYDLRFPEVFRLMALHGAMVIIVPAAFNMTSGPAHWDILFRCRAADNQVYMIAASPARDDSAPYVAYGRSMIVDPWGTIIAGAGESAQVITAEISHEKIERIRRELPLLDHRRPDLYRSWFCAE